MTNFAFGPKKKNVVQCEKDIKMVFVFLFNSK